MKILIDYCTVRDQHGEGQAGKTVVYYPYTTIANGTTAVDLGAGEYKVTIDPTANNNKIDRYYDIYVNAVKEHEKVWVAEWVWYVELAVNVSPKVVAFNALVDENGDALPTTIPNAKIEFCFPEKCRGFALTAHSDTGFTIIASEYSDDDAILPVDLHFKVTVGEA